MDIDYHYCFKMLKIRLKRFGRKRVPIYRIVVMDSRTDVMVDQLKRLVYIIQFLKSLILPIFVNCFIGFQKVLNVQILSLFYYMKGGSWTY